MGSNSRFAVAVHVLALLASENKILSSSYIAASVNTNPVNIRQTLASLKKSGLVTTTAGSLGGASLKKKAEEISLLEVYKIIKNEELLKTHNPNPACPIGANIQQVLNNIFDDAEISLLNSLAKKTIASVVKEVKEEAKNKISNG